jgi:hypothetical protein
VKQDHLAAMKLAEDVVDAATDRANRNRHRIRSDWLVLRHAPKAHKAGVCPAVGRRCTACGIEGHFKIVCKQGGGKSNQGGGREDMRIHQVEKSDGMNALLKCMVNDVKVVMLIDSGADVSTIDESTWLE